MNSQDEKTTNSTYDNYNLVVSPLLTFMLSQHSSSNGLKNETDIQKVKTLKAKPPMLDEAYLKTKSSHIKPRMKVQPLRDKNDIERAKAYFYNTKTRYSHMNMRDYLMFIVGLNTARRGGDIGKLQVSNFLEENGEFKTHLIINEGKTGKKATILIHPNVKEAMVEYLNLLGEYSMSDYLFANYKTKTPLTTNAIWKRFKKMQKALELKVNVGSHTPRKTFATQASKNNPNDSATEMKISDFLNHANVETTHIYTEAGQDEMDEFILRNGI